MNAELKSMRRRVKMTRRWTRSALTVSVAASMVLAGGARFVRADDSSGADPASDGCIVSYHAIGSAVALGVGYEIPFESVGGGPYGQVELTSDPRSSAVASTGYAGFVAELVLQTSGVYQDNPTTAQAYYPKPEGGRAADGHDYGLSQTSATAGQVKTVADARAFPFGTQEQGSAALAHSDTAYDGKGLSGSQVATGYDISLGSVHIDFMRSQVDFRVDGTHQGTLAGWKLEFHGVRNGGVPVYGVTGDGFTFQGGSGTPGDAQRRQFNEQQQKLSQALDQAGISQAELQVTPGAVEVTASQVDVKGAGLVMRAAPKATRGTTTNAASLQFGRVEEHAGITTGPCGGGGDTPATQGEGIPKGPNPPKVPPEKCDNYGCHAQKVPPAPPQGPPPLPLPGGKQAPVTTVGSEVPNTVVTVPVLPADVLRLLPSAALPAPAHQTPPLR
jgi:hypothetical protein